jgi:hypothetical protein
MSGTSEGTRVPSEAALDAAVEAFLVAYDAEECEDGEGIYCAKCLKRALLAALSARPAVGERCPTCGNTEADKLIASTADTLARIEALSRPAAGPGFGSACPKCGGITKCACPAAGSETREAALREAHGVAQSWGAAAFSDAEARMAKWIADDIAKLAAVPPSPDATTDAE